MYVNNLTKLFIIYEGKRRNVVYYCYFVMIIMKKKGKMRNLHFSLPTKEKGTGLHIDAESWLNEAEHHATEMNHGPETCSRT